MAKSTDDIKELQRCLVRLSRLDGADLRLADGLWLIWPEKVADPNALFAACESDDGPTIAALLKAVRMKSAPIELSAAWLAGAHYDLRRLEGMLRGFDFMKHAPRMFRRYAGLGPSWIEERRARLAALSEELRRPSAADPALRLARALHGGASAEALASLIERCKRPAHAARADLPRDEALAADAKRTARLLGLAFRADGGQRPLERLERADVELVRRKLDSAYPWIAGITLRIGEALAFLRLPLAREQAITTVASWIAAGLSIELIEGLIKVDYLDKALDFGVFRAPGGEGAAAGSGEGAGEPPRGQNGAHIADLEAYCEWVLRLIPHYKSLDIKVELPVSAFMNLLRAGGRGGDLAILARCLLEHERAPTPDAAPSAIRVLDTTFGLFQRVPEAASGLLSSLTAPSPGAGRAAFPEFADWLGDDALLDRYVMLCRLAGEPIALSRSLLRDASRATRVQKQIEHLGGLQAPTDEQAARRDNLARAASAEPRGPAWTRRRLEERTQELLAKAYRKGLDDALREILRRAFRISIPSMTEAWRDAIRFYLATERNHEGLATILRFAAAHPGEPITSALPKNQAWIERASSFMNVDAWLADRRWEGIEIEAPTKGGAGPRARCSIHVESDPIEVLRMGIPFGTCLSITDGCNAASTVINALDANKRVIYLRDERGRPVARKLIAISKDKALIGYRVYQAIDPGRAPQIAALFTRFCEEIAAACGLPLAARGQPEPIHEGFWYDDEPEAFSRGQDPPDVAAYCASLGRTTPPVVSRELRRAAAAFAARARGDVEGALEGFGSWSDSPEGVEQGAWIVERLGWAEARRRTRSVEALVAPVLRRAAKDGARAVCEVAAALPMYSFRARDVIDTLAGLPPGAAAARALVEAAVSWSKSGEKTDNEGLEHATIYALDRHFRGMSAAEIFDVLDKITPVWALVVERSPDCRSCRDDAVTRAIEICWRVHSERPDREAAIECIKSRRRSLASHRAALRIVARSAAAAGSPGALRAVLALRNRRPELEGDPDMLAALIRCSAGAPRIRVALPSPSSSPWSALGDLLLEGSDQARAAETSAAAFADPACAPKDWRPDAWELAFHRRRPTKWKARLARAAASDGDLVALRWLSILGDVEALKQIDAAAAQAGKPSMTRDRRGDSRRSPGGPPPRYRTAEALRVAEAAAWQLEEPEPGKLLSPRKEAKKRTVRIEEWPKEALDPVFLERARRLVAASIERADLSAGAGTDFAEKGALVDTTEPSQALRAALSILWLADIPSAEWHDIVERMLDNLEGRAPGLILWETATRVLKEKVTWSASELSERLILKLWSVEEARPILLDTLSRTASEGWLRMVDALEAAAQIASPPVDLAGFFEGWVERLLEQNGLWLAIRVDTWERFDRMLEVALRTTGPEKWIDIYRKLDDFASRSRFLDALGQREGTSEAELRELSGLIAKTRWDDPAAPIWLADALSSAEAEDRAGDAAD